MKNLVKISLTVSLIFNVFSFSIAQTKVQKESEKIVKEGKLLYKSEMASWYGTDLFLEKYKEKRKNLGGYFSYTESDTSKCIFFSQGVSPTVIGTISFDHTYNIHTAKIDVKERSFTKNETDLHAIRTKSLATINSDTLFKKYQNTDLNIIPLIDGESKKVYVLTGPQKSGVVIFGNDYLLTFDDANNLIQSKNLHKNIIPITYTSNEPQVAAVHNHQPETGDLITATDICTLMLYEKFAKWNQHYVFSKDYVSIWDCQKDILATMTRKGWDNLNKEKK